MHKSPFLGFSREIFPRQKAKKKNKKKSLFPKKMVTHIERVCVCVCVGGGGGGNWSTCIVVSSHVMLSDGAESEITRSRDINHE